METLQKDGDGKKDLDDSGCVQDVGPPSKQSEMENRSAELMDLSDDVLLYILRYCCPRDLKALGFTCPRLGRLIQDRTLWTRVDARSQPTGRARMRWLLSHALTATTTTLLLSGYAREASGCLGHVNRKRKEVEDEKAMRETLGDKEPSASTSDFNGTESSRGDGPVQIIQVDPLTRLQQLYAPGVSRQNNHNNGNTPSRFGGSPSWPADCPSTAGRAPPGCCPGPQFTLTQCTLRQLSAHCALTELALQYCNLDCRTTGIAHFPPTLKKLSLLGTKCYNLPLDKSFLFNIQDYLPELEDLELSECEWLEPASLLPLSKVPRLKRLVMGDCCRLSEFVAYASLATRYGFRKLEILDLRGSPVADSEVSALGWLPALQELYVCPASSHPPAEKNHSHCQDDSLPQHTELEPWEMEEPEYFKIKPQVPEPMESRPNITIDDIEEHIEQLRDYESNICLHGTQYNLCMDGIRNNTSRKRPAESDTTPQNDVQKPKLPETPEENDSKGKYIVLSRSPGGDSLIQSRLEDLPNNIDEPGPSSKRKKENPSENGPSCSKEIESNTTCFKKTDSNTICFKKSDSNGASSSKETDSNGSKMDSDSSDDENESKNINNGENINNSASTSKTDEKPNTKEPSQEMKEEVIEYVRFRHNMDPVVVRRDQQDVERDGEHREREQEDNREARPRAHVLYVNVGQRLHTVYRLSIHNEPPIFYSFAGNSHLRFRPNVGNIFTTPPTPHLDATSLVSDSAVRRFGRADVEDVNYIHIGPRQVPGEPGARPNRSSLRILSITGFRNITDRSLVHLATAAPDLRLIDFSGTRVTEQGVENFKSLRPDCEVIYSPYVEKDDNL